MTASIMLIILLTLTGMALIFALVRLRDAKRAHATLHQTHDELLRRFQPVVDVDRERERVTAEISTDRVRFEQERQRLIAETARERAESQAASLGARAEFQTLLTNLERLRQEFSVLDEESNLQSFGFYKPRYEFADSIRYQTELDAIRGRQKQMLKDKTAATCSIEWTVNGSKSEGKKQINQTLKLMLRAFNGECDAAIAKVRYNNVQVMEARIKKACETINGLAEVQSCRIAPNYLQLKLQELSLVHEYEEKLQAEKEEQRRIREQMREEEVALREIEKARQDAEKEEARYARCPSKGAGGDGAGVR